MADSILIINAGSSSLKFSLYQDNDGNTFTSVASGLLEGIGTKPYLKIVDQHKKVLIEKNWEDPKLAQLDARDTLCGETLEWIFNYSKKDPIVAVGHRVVHGGSKYVNPVLIDEVVYQDLEALTPFVPLHQPASLSPMRVMLHNNPGIPQIACFDTAFHATMPDKAKRFALPRRYFDKGVRRYGFHGLSYQYIVHYLKQTDHVLASGKTIIAHLGNGASVSAVYQGKCVDTSMSFTPLDGLVMGTRTGHIDAALILYMLNEEKMSPDEIETLIWKKSGLLGVSEVSSDMRDVEAEIANNGPKAEFCQQALELFKYALVGEIGRLAAGMGGIDGLIFTAGIGENARELRSEICKSLSWLGIKIDEEANRSKKELISMPNSTVIVKTIPTNEESVMLREVHDLIN
ncbi:Acetate kinase [Commensalibacter sp. Nvir]|uniref:acetate/propionate family kinase n=1 Tax=Commensalibacter sp. Nvir TaxID=3069817 RepID=UPI002D5EA3A5|nr:Acetate kinase [Commensalibacter sp. Nvir]